jgi:hypothetical protein
MRSPSCLCIYVSSPSSTFKCLNQSLWNFVHITWQLNPSRRRTYKSLPSFCVSLCVSLLSFLGNGSAKTRHFLCGPCLIKGESALCLCIPLSLLGNNSVKTFPRQQRIVGGIVFYAVRFVTKERRRAVLPRISFFLKMRINFFIRVKRFFSERF